MHVFSHLLHFKHLNLTPNIYHQNPEVSRFCPLSGFHLSCRPCCSTASLQPRFGSTVGGGPTGIPGRFTHVFGWYIWGFPKLVGFPSKPVGFPTKNDHFGVCFGGTSILGNPYDKINTSWWLNHPSEKY